MKSLGQEGSFSPLNLELFWLVWHAEQDAVATNEDNFRAFQEEVKALKERGADLNTAFDFAGTSKTLLDIVTHPQMTQFLNEQGAHSFCGPEKNKAVLSTLDARDSFFHNNDLEEIGEEWKSLKVINLTGYWKTGKIIQSIKPKVFEKFLTDHAHVCVIVGEDDYKTLGLADHPQIRIEANNPRKHTPLPATNENFNLLQSFIAPDYQQKKQAALDNILYLLILDAKERKLSDNTEQFELFKTKLQHLVERGARINRSFQEGTLLDCAVGDIELFKFIYDKLLIRRAMFPTLLLKKHQGVVTELDMSHVPVTNYHLAVLRELCPDIKAVNLTGSVHCVSVLTDYLKHYDTEDKPTIQIAMDDLIRLGFLHSISTEEENSYQGFGDLERIKSQVLRSFIEQMSEPNAFKLGEGRLALTAFSINQTSLEFSCYDASYKKLGMPKPITHLLSVQKNVSMIELDGTPGGVEAHKVDLNDAFIDLMEGLRKYESIRCLSIKNFKLSAEQLESVIELFGQNRDIELLELSDDCLDKEALAVLGAHLGEKLVVGPTGVATTRKDYTKLCIMRKPTGGSVFRPFDEDQKLTMTVCAEFEIDPASYSKHIRQTVREKDTFHQKIHSIVYNRRITGYRAPLMFFQEKDVITSDELSHRLFSHVLDDSSREFELFERFYYRYRFFQFIGNDENFEIFWALRDWVNASERTFRESQIRLQQLKQLAAFPRLELYYKGVFLGLRSRFLACGLKYDDSKGKEEADSSVKRPGDDNGELAQILTHKLAFLQFASGGEFPIDNTNVEFHLVQGSPFYVRAIKLFELTARLVTWGAVRQAEILALNSDAEVKNLAEQAAADMTQMIIYERVGSFSTIEQTAGGLAAAELLGIQKINEAVERLQREKDLMHREQDITERLKEIKSQIESVSTRTDLVLKDTNAINTTTKESQEQIKKVIEGQVELLEGQRKLLDITTRIESTVKDAVAKLDIVVKALPNIHETILAQLKQNEKVTSEQFEQVQEALKWQRELSQRQFESFQEFKEKSTQALADLHKDINLMVASTANPTQQAQYYFPGNTKLHSFCQEMFIFASGKIEKYKDIVNGGEIPEDSFHSALNFVGSNADMVPVPFVPLVLKGLVAIGKGIYNGFKKNRAKKITTFSMDDILFALVRRTGEAYALTIEQLADHGSIVALASTAFGLITTNIIVSKLFEEQDLEGKSNRELEDLLLAGLLAEHSIHQLPGGKRTPFVGTPINFEEPKALPGQPKHLDVKKLAKKGVKAGIGALHGAINGIPEETLKNKAKEFLKSKSNLDVDTEELIPIIKKGKKLLNAALTVFTHEPTAEAALMFPSGIIVRGADSMERYYKDQTGLAPNIMENMAVYQCCFITTEILSHAKKAKDMEARILEDVVEVRSETFRKYLDDIKIFGDTLNDPDDTEAEEVAKAMREAAGKRLFFQSTLLAAECIEIGSRPADKDHTWDVTLTFLPEEFNRQCIGLSSCAPLVTAGDKFLSEFKATFSCRWEMFEIIEAAERFVHKQPKLINSGKGHEVRPVAAIALAPPARAESPDEAGVGPRIPAEAPPGDGAAAARPPAASEAPPGDGAAARPPAPAPVEMPAAPVHTDAALTTTATAHTSSSPRFIGGKPSPRNGQGSAAASSTPASLEEAEGSAERPPRGLKKCTIL